jgi:hypothetical protein
MRRPAQLTLVSFIVLSLAAGVYARRHGDRCLEPQREGWTALKSAAGVMFVWNRHDLGFTIELAGNRIQPLNDPDHIFFDVDGLVFQIQSLPISDFAPEAKKQKLNNQSILAAHRDWESQFISQQLLRTKVIVKSSDQNLVSGREVMFWSFDLPENLRTNDAKTQVYLTTVAGDYVILLNSVVGEAGSVAVVNKFLLDTIATLKVSASPIDVKQLQESLRKGQTG